MIEGIKHKVDIVLCIDATGSMVSGIEDVKKAAIKFPKDLGMNMSKKGKPIGQMRVKVIEFRDFYRDIEKAYRESAFYLLPAEQEAFEEFVNSIKTKGRRYMNKNGYEAVDMAIKSDWDKTVEKGRHIIVVWTDGDKHKPENHNGSKSQNYPNGMAKNFEELTDNWDKYPEPRYKRLILFAPDAYPWTNMSNHWENTVHFPSRAGKGLDDISYQEIHDCISRGFC